MSTLTPEQEQAIADKVATIKHLACGLGTIDCPCTLAAINLALTGRLIDTIPDCMSLVIGRWIVRIQDAMPAETRDSQAWRDLVPWAAGTGHDFEPQRLAIIKDHMWDTVLPHLQPVADRHGFGSVWASMCTKRTKKAANAARDAASVHYEAASAANAAAYIAGRQNRDAIVTEYAAIVKYAVYATSAAAWKHFDPPGLLAKLIAAQQEASQ